MHTLLVDVEVYAFPAVEQYLAVALGMGELVAAGPAVEVAAHAAGAAVAVCQGQGRGGKGLAAGEGVGRVGLVDAGQQRVVLGVVGDQVDTVVAAILEGGADGASGAVVGATVEREHYLAVGGLRVAGAVVVDYRLDAGAQRLLHEVGLVGPRAGEMAQPYVAAAHGQICRGIAAQGDGAALAVGDLGPGVYHVGAGIGAVTQGYVDRILAVAHTYGGDGQAVGVGISVGGDYGGVEGHVAVGMGDGYRRGGLCDEAVGGIGVVALLDGGYRCGVGVGGSGSGNLQ